MRHCCGSRIGAVESLLCLVVVLSLLGAVSPFSSGDSVPCSRRAQFHGSRTQWHDLLGKHCPRYGQSRTVALPVPRPLGFLPGDSYKIQLSFDGDRQLSSWLTVIDKLGSSAAPLVDVELAHAPGGALASVRVATQPLPPSYLVLHKELVEQFSNSSHWPKHVLVHYRWRDGSETDERAALFLLLTGGLALSFLLIGRGVFSNAVLSKVLAESDVQASQGDARAGGKRE